MVRRPKCQLGGLGFAVRSPAGSGIFSFFDVFSRINTDVTHRTDANYWEGCSRNSFGGMHTLDRHLSVLIKL